MNLKSSEMLLNKPFPYLTDGNTGDKIYTPNHREFQERLRKTLYYGQYTDGTLPSPTVTDVAVKLMNSKTNRKKSLDKYQAMKLTRRARISPCALMMGILYTERLAQSNPSYLRKVSSSDLFMVSMLVASKYLYDDGEEQDVYNYDWCKAGNYHIRDLNRLEREFLVSIGWRIFVGCKEFFEFVNKVEASVALDLGVERGWFTYMDIGIFLENLKFQNFVKTCLKKTGKIILACTLAYSVSVALLVSSAQAVTRSARQSSAPVANELSIRPQLENPFHSSITQKKGLGFRDNLELAMSDQDQEKNYTNGNGGECQKCGLSVQDVQLESKLWTRKHDTKQTQNNLGNCIISRAWDDFNLHQVLSLVISLNNTWVYRDVAFPVWENSYSGILIGFSTSAAA